MANGDFATRWYSEKVYCSAFATGDRDGDGELEIYVGAWDSWDYYEAALRVVILGTDQLVPIASVRVRKGSIHSTVNDIALHDVDSDGNTEIVVVTGSDTAVYDSQTLQLEWLAEGKGGKSISIGDLDSDGTPELVVNGSNLTRVFDCASHTEEYAWVGGFGFAIEVGDVDSDGRCEVIFSEETGGIGVLETESFTPIWTAVPPSYGRFQAINIADLDGDGLLEVLAAHGQTIYAFAGADGTLLWTLENVGASVWSISTGDVDGDGVSEVICYVENSSLVVVDIESGNVVWTSDRLGGPLHVAPGDIDGDGRPELIMASSNSDNDRSGGIIRLIDLHSGIPIWSLVSELKIEGAQLGQVDSDTNLEVIIVGTYWPQGNFIYVYDGLTGELEWQSGTLGYGESHALEVADLDKDSTDEIIVSFGGRACVLNGPTPMILWDSGELGNIALGNVIRDISVGAVSLKKKPELALITNDSLLVMDTETWTQQVGFDLEDGQSVQLAFGQIVIATGDPTGITYDDEETALQGFSPAGNLSWERSFGPRVVSDMDAAWLLGKRCIVAAGYWDDHETMLSILSADGAEELAAKTGGCGRVYSVSALDMDGDRGQELILGCGSSVEVDKVFVDTGGMLGLGSAAASPGSAVTLDLVLTSGNSSVATIIAEIFFGGDISLVAVEPGQAALAAGKIVSVGVLADGARVSITGSGSNDISDGVVAEVELVLADDVEPGVKSVPVEIVSAIDNDGFAVRLDAREGAVVVSEPWDPAGCSGTPLWFVAASAHVAGEGDSLWRTDLSIQSSMLTPASVPMWFFPRDSDNTDALCIDVGAVDPGASVYFEDVVQGVFGISGAGGIGIGDALDPFSNLAVSSRTYNQTGSGTFGQSIPGRTESDAVAPQQSVWLSQLHENERYRTNLGFLEVSGAGAEVEVRLYTQDASSLGSRSYTLRAYEALQVNSIFGSSVEVTNGFAVVTVTSGGAVLPYASVVDNQTGDPTYIEPQ
jgi:hypothetical protein